MPGAVLLYLKIWSSRLNSRFWWHNIEKVETKLENNEHVMTKCEKREIK